MDEHTARIEETREHVAALVGSVFAAGEGAAALDDHDLLTALRSLGAIGRFAEACIVECIAEVLTRSAGLARDDRLTTLAGCRDAVELTQRALLTDRAHASRIVTAAKGVRREPQPDGTLRPARYEALREVLLAGDLAVTGFLAATQELDRAGARIGAADRERADAELAAIARGVGYVPVVADPAGDPEDGTGADAGHEDDSGDDAAAGARLRAAVPVRPLPEDLRRCAERVLAHLDPDGAEPRDREASSRRGIRLGQARDGLVSISGRLETAVAAGFLRIVDAIEKPKGKKTCVEFTDSAAADDDAASGDAADAPTLPRRLREQILHDVFATVVNIAARSEETPAIGGAARRWSCRSTSRRWRPGPGTPSWKARTSSRPMRSPSRPRATGSSSACSRTAAASSASRPATGSSTRPSAARSSAGTANASSPAVT